MAASILKVDPLRPDPESIDRAAAILRRGGIVAVPTETFYGLAVDPGRPAAVDRLFRLKGRPAGKPILLLLRETADLARVARQPFPEPLPALADAFWPGPLTLVLPARPGAAADGIAVDDRIAVRVTPNRVARTVIGKFGGPVTGTSANRSGRPPATDAGAVAADLGEGVDLILDAGAVPGGTASTLLDLTTRPCRILRPGAVSRRRIGEVLGGPLG